MTGGLQAKGYLRGSRRMVMEITVRSHFDAAHFLPDYPGKCSRVHGHRWVVEASFEGKPDPLSGMLRDFADLKLTLALVCDKLDHHLINQRGKELSSKLLERPTAENLAVWLYQQLQPACGALMEERAGLTQVRVFESPDCWVTYRGS